MPDPLEREKSQLMGQNVGGKLNLLNEAELNACAQTLHDFRQASPARMQPQPRPAPKKEEPAPPPPKKQDATTPLPSDPGCQSGPSWAQYDAIKDPYESGRYWKQHGEELREQAQIIHKLLKADKKH